MKLRSFYIVFFLVFFTYTSRSHSLPVEKNTFHHFKIVSDQGSSHDFALTEETEPSDDEDLCDVTNSEEDEEHDGIFLAVSGPDALRFVCVSHYSNTFCSIKISFYNYLAQRKLLI